MTDDKKKQLRELIDWHKAKDALEAAGMGDEVMARLESGVQASDVMQFLARSFVGTADAGAARNFVTFAMDGLTAPFDRIQVEIVRKGGKHSTELVKELRDAMSTALALIKGSNVDPGVVAAFEKSLYDRDLLVPVKP